MKAYKPQPGTIPHKVITFLSRCSAGAMVPGAIIIEEMGLDVVGLAPFMKPAIKAGVVRTEHSPENRRVWLYGLGDGIPLPEGEKDEPLRPAPEPEPEQREPIATAWREPVTHRTQPDEFRAGLFDDGTLQLDIDDRTIVLTAEQTQRVARLLRA